MSLLSAIGNMDTATHTKMEYSVLWAEHQEAIQKIQVLEKENALLKEQLLLMKQRHFGKKTEVGEALANTNNHD